MLTEQEQDDEVPKTAITQIDDSNDASIGLQGTQSAATGLEGLDDGERTRKDLITKSFEEKKFVHTIVDEVFQPVVASEMAVFMTADDLPAFDAALWAAWGEQEKHLEYIETPLIDAFEAFVMKDYVSIMEGVIKEAITKTKVYALKYPVDHDGAAADEIEKRMNLAAQLDEKLGAEGELRVLSKWHAFMQIVGDAARDYYDSNKPTDNFWRKHYYPSLLEVVAEAKSKLDRVDWTPSLSPEVEGTQDEIEERARLLSLIAPHQGQQAEAKVKELWTLVYDSSDAHVQEVLSRTQPPNKFYQKNLYEVLQELLGEGVGERKVDGTSADHAARNASGAEVTSPPRAAPSVAGTADSHSPGVGDMAVGLDALMGVTTSDRERRQEQVAQYKSSVDIMSVPSNTKVMFEGRITRYDTEPRLVKNIAKKRKADDSEGDRTALDVMVVDNYGPIQVILWDDATKTFLEQLAAAQSAATDSNIGYLYLHLSIASVLPLPNNSWNGSSLTDIRVLHSITSIKSRIGTEVTIRQTPTSPYMVAGEYKVPEGKLCITMFALQQKKFFAPFRATLTGTIMELKDLDYSQQGNPVRYFKLVDPAGSFLNCCAMDDHVSSQALRENMRVVLYFGTGRGPIRSSPGCIHVRKDAALVPLGVKLLAGLPTKEMTIENKPE